MTARKPSHRIGFGGRHVRLPQSRAFRIGIGIALVVVGLFGFLPILGFWMIPLGLLILSIDLPLVRRARRRFVVWWARRREAWSGRASS